MEKPRLPKAVLQFFKETGAQGGNERAKRYSKEQLAEWGKKGGRPKGSGNAKETKTKGGK
jgi:general stress protein YciG